MSAIRIFVARAREERGSVVAFVAVGLMALLAVFAIVIDVGNWYLHKRALQNQVDAAALAGSQRFGACFATGATPTSAMDSMKAVAKNYTGDPATASPNYNPQVGDGKTKGDIWVGYNAQAYLSNPGGTSTGLIDNLSNPADNPCEPDYIFDVKETDSNLALIMHGFLPGFGKLGHVQARARVQLKQEIISTSSMPLAVANVNPNTVSATFVDEATGAALAGCSNGCVFPLVKAGSSGSPPLNMWGGDATIPAPTAGQKIGVRIGLAYATSGCANVDGGDGFFCVDNVDLKKGLVTLRGESSATGTAAAPTLKAIWPTTLCSGTPFFSDYNVGSGCGTGVQAKVDFGTGTTDPRLAVTAGGVGAKVFATINGTRVELGSYDNVTKVWSTAGNAWTLLDGLGPLEVSADWEEHSGTVSGKDCSKTPLPNVCKGTWSSDGSGTSQTGWNQILYSGSAANSDPVKTIAVTEAAATNAGAPYSLASGSHTVHVTVGLQGSIQISSSPVLLRGLGGSRTTAVRCYPGGGTASFNAAIINGCPNQFQLNDWQAGDPDPGLCSGNDPTTADPTPPPNNTVTPDCIALEPGGFGVPSANAFDTRYAACPANHYGEAGYVYDPATDKRVVQLFVTDFSYLSGSGRTTVPIVDFAEFYVTGWKSSGAGGCGSPPNQPWPFAGSPRTGDIWGYFIKTVNNLPGGGGPLRCDPERLTPCVPVMTR